MLGKAIEEIKQSYWCQSALQHVDKCIQIHVHFHDKERHGIAPISCPWLDYQSGSEPSILNKDHL